MARFFSHHLIRGVGICALVLVLVYMYMALRETKVQLSHIFNQATSSPGHHQNKSTPKPSGAKKDDCILTKTNPAFHVCVYPTKQDLYISGALRSSGVWEGQITNRFQMALRKFPQATVIDVGANIGYYALLAAAMGHPTIAVEATRANVEKLEQGVQLNGFSNKVHVLHNAVAESRKNVSMAVNKNNQGGIKVLENATGHEVVQAILMDDLIPFIHTNSVIVIMDIEGYECHAIAGSSQLFRKVQVTHVFMEWSYLSLFRHKPDAACPARAMGQISENHFEPLGYVPHDVRSNKALDPHKSPDWGAADVYWRRKDLPPLT